MTGNEWMETRIRDFENSLYQEEKAELTIQKYIRDIRKFCAFLGKDQQISREKTLAYKEYLKQNYQVSSANSMIASLNRFLVYVGCPECRVRQFKTQKRMFCKKDKTLKKCEYEALLHAAAQNGDLQLNLLMQTICSTGIRVSEVCFITAESLKQGYAEIVNKGKSRIVLFPRQLIRLLKAFCRSNGIEHGALFLSGRNKPLSRTGIWKRMKQLCGQAGVEPGKVFPHNLRHLFAQTFYRQEKDILRLAEVLGHSSIETTRIYTTTTGEEHRQILSKLKLVYDVGEWGMGT